MKIAFRFVVAMVLSLSAACEDKNAMRRIEAINKAAAEAQTAAAEAPESYILANGRRITPTPREQLIFDALSRAPIEGRFDRPPHIGSAEEFMIAAVIARFVPEGFICEGRQIVAVKGEADWNKGVNECDLKKLLTENNVMKTAEDIRRRSR